MQEIYCTAKGAGLSENEMCAALESFLDQYPDVRKVLIIPPDYTRCYSYAGEITKALYSRLMEREQSPIIHVMPALGTHMAMDEQERKLFFDDVVPEDAFIVHHWQTDTISIGQIPPEVTGEISGGSFTEPIEVEVNHLLMDGGYDLIVSVGQVVPHEVVGMANYSKNIFVGIGGRQMINKSHMLSAICGMEEALGVTDSPARKLFDYGQRNFLDDKVPLVYIQTVTTLEGEVNHLNGMYIGTSRRPFELAAALATEKNIVHVDHYAKKVVAYLEPMELKTTWVGNKGIYRTRMMVADGGELLLLAPGVKSFGENEEMDKLIRQYGYKGTKYVLDLYNAGVFENKTMAAAHLIQGTCDDRFRITYCTRSENLTEEEIKGVGYNWMEYDTAAKRYDPETLKDGWNTLPDGEEIYFVKTPALGLWKVD